MSILNALVSENYFIINRNLVKNLGLDSAVMIGELASEYDYFQKHNELVDGWFYSTIENVEERTTLSKYNQNKIINDLKEKGIVETKLKGVPAKRYIKINEDKLEIFLQQDREKISKLDSKNFNQLDGTNFNQLDGTKMYQLYKNNKYKNNNKNIYIKNIDKIINYLNDKTNSHYKSSTSSTQKSIIARFKEGYTLDDFTKVIDTKCDDWLGTDYEKYLNPSTLFRPTNFEKYLNQKNKKKSSTKEKEEKHDIYDNLTLL